MVGHQRQRLRHPQRRVAQGPHAQGRRRLCGSVRHSGRPLQRSTSGVHTRPGHESRRTDRPRCGAGQRMADRGGVLVGREAGAVRQRSPEPAGRSGGPESAEERRGCRYLAATPQGLPLYICGDAGAHQGALRTVAHRRGEGRDRKASAELLIREVTGAGRGGLRVALRPAELSGRSEPLGRILDELRTGMRGGAGKEHQGARQGVVALPAQGCAPLTDNSRERSEPVV